MSRIRALSPHTISQIQSSKQITTLQGVVLALLENSLDAACNKVDIRINFRRGACNVQDNGIGILADDFLQSGGLGRMFHTSKPFSASSTQLYGSTGSYLASLAALSLLNITSQRAVDNRKATLTIHQGRVIRRQVSATSTNAMPSSIACGTQVDVRDLFGNMPVRVKQRALEAHGQKDHDKSWNELKYGIVALLLAWPKPCSVNIRDEEDGSIVLRLSALHPTVTAALTEKNLKSLLRGAQATFELQDALPLLYQAGFATNESRRNWIPVSASIAQLTIKGAICIDPAPSKRCQFISIGVHPCFPTSGHNYLFQTVNNIFANSSFGAVGDDSDVDEAEKYRRKYDARFKETGFTQRQLRGRKHVDRWPMFVFKIRSNDQSMSNFEPDRLSDASLKAIDDVLETMVTEWLASNHFRPRKPRKRGTKGSLSRDAVSPSKQEIAPGSVVERQPSTPSITTTNPQDYGIICSATTLRKRKYIDISGNPHTVSQQESLRPESASGYFNSWSRIKSGRGDFYDQVRQSRKPATAPAGQTGTMNAANERHPESNLELPVLEAGSLNNKLPERDTAAGTDRDDNIQSSQTNRLHHPAPLGDDNQEVHAAAEHSEYFFDRTDQIPRMNNPTGEDGDSNDIVVEWTDPISKGIHKINARTGLVLPVMTGPSTANSGSALDVPPEFEVAEGKKKNVSSSGISVSLTRRPKSTPSPEANWLPGFLKDWNNPVFAPQGQDKVPALSYDMGVQFNGNAAQQCTHELRTNVFAEIGAVASSKLTKSALKHMKVIKQVDKKYILCKMKMEEGLQCDETLVMIDQHAASERVVLEKLLAELCEPVDQDMLDEGLRMRSVGLEKALRFEVSKLEYEKFREYQSHFTNWGILYGLAEKDEVLSASQARAPKRSYVVIVRSLPPGIAERCVLLPKLLIELLRSEIWSIADSATRPKSQYHANVDRKHSDGEHHWLQRIGSCPKGIIDMLNSRACRSAIMFNDELSIRECEELLEGLSVCAFPFMCAHGRVSMVPIAKDGVGWGLDSSSGWDSIESTSFVAAFKKWKGESSNVDSSMMQQS